MTDEEYFGNLKLMFSTEGWLALLEELNTNFNVIDNIQAVSDENDLHFRKGQLAVLAYMINLEETIKRAEADSEASQ